MDLLKRRGIKIVLDFNKDEVLYIINDFFFYVLKIFSYYIRFLFNILYVWIKLGWDCIK